MNKKFIVPFLSSIIGLSMAGGIGGAFAWYQYNSQVTASFVGASVADTSVLQIGHDAANNTIDWGKDYYKGKTNLVPVTFGQVITDSTRNNKENCLALPAYGYPEAGKQGTYSYENWTQINPNEGYVQFNVYLRALKADKVTQADLDVYLSDITLEGVITDNQGHVIETETSAYNSKMISEAARIHLDIDNADNRLISKTAIGLEHQDPADEQSPMVGALKLYGELDLDGDGQPDKPSGYSWETNPNADPIIYGNNGDRQTTQGIADVVNPRVNGDIVDDQSKVICKTKTDGNVKITVTVWLEGWHLLKSEVDTEHQTFTTGAVWDPAYSANMDIRVGMTFDVGKVRLSA